MEARYVDKNDRIFFNLKKRENTYMTIVKVDCEVWKISTKPLINLFKRKQYIICLFLECHT